MKKRVKDIAETQIGYHFDKKIVPDQNGNYRIIQMRDIDGRSMLDTSSLVRVSLDRNVDRYLVQKGDVLFVSRGSNNAAAVVDMDLDKTVPVSYFFLVRLKTDEVLPAFVVWYINQPSSQAVLKKDLKGSYIPMISKDDFQNFTIEIPPLSIQQAIVELDALKRRENELLHIIAERKEYLVNSICMKAVREENLQR
jgi:restriction endonuclease S subunit